MLIEWACGGKIYLYLRCARQRFNQRDNVCDAPLFRGLVGLIGGKRNATLNPLVSRVDARHDRALNGECEPRKCRNKDDRDIICIANALQSHAVRFVPPLEKRGCYHHE